MKVLYDHQIFTMQTYGGISRYFYELINSTRQKSPSSLKLGLKFSNNAYLNHDSINLVYPFFPNKNFYRKQWLYNIVNENFSKLAIRKGDYDVFHPTYYNPYFLNLIKDRPYVITCYDMIHEIYAAQYPELLGWDPLIIEKKKQLIKNAAKVIAISEQTKLDIMSIYGMDGSNIEVIYLGSSLIDQSANHEAIVKDPYLLFVGNRPIYKNFSGLIHGVHQVLHKNNIKLICAGGGDFDEGERKLIKHYNLEAHVLFVPFKTDLQLSNLYHNAISFIFPSLYEGFGIPVLEAFACNCPVVMSAGGSLGEVGGDAAIYFKPEDPESIHEAISRVVGNSELRDKLRFDGSERLKLFSWDKTYKETFELYKTLV